MKTIGFCLLLASRALAAELTLTGSGTYDYAHGDISLTLNVNDFSPHQSLFRQLTLSDGSTLYGAVSIPEGGYYSIGLSLVLRRSDLLSGYLNFPPGQPFSTDWRVTSNDQQGHQSFSDMLVNWDGVNGNGAGTWQFGLLEAIPEPSLLLTGLFLVFVRRVFVSIVG